MRILLVCFVVAISMGLQAQDNKYAAKRAANAVAFISSGMDITDEQAQFVENTLYTKYAENALKIKGNNLSQEEKKAVYKSAFITTRKILREQFSEEDVKSIVKLERQSNKK